MFNFARSEGQKSCRRDSRRGTKCCVSEKEEVKAYVAQETMVK